MTVKPKRSDEALDRKQNPARLKGDGRRTKRFSGCTHTIRSIFHFSLTFLIAIMISNLFSASTMIASPEQDEAIKLADEYTKEERQKHVSELLALGDQLFDEKNYTYALAAYEEVFLLDPDNPKASARIDRLKKQASRDGKDEIGIVRGVYEEQAKERVRKYWLEAREYLKEKKYGQARFAVEKILLLDPESKEAIALYEDLKKVGRGLET